MSLAAPHPRSLRLLVDGRPLVGNRTGIGVHAAEIASRLTLGEPPLIASHAPIADRSGLESCRFVVDRAPLGVIWQQLLLPGVARREEADVLWGPHGTLPLGGGTPAVITMHDLTSITMIARHRLQTILSFNLLVGRSIDKARMIACVSRTTADELCRTFAVDRGRVAVVPNGVSRFFEQGEEHDEPVPGVAPRSYILYAGTIEPRKGVEDLVAAWSSLPQPRPRLVLCGGAGWKSTALMETIRRTPEIVVTGYVSRETLRSLYRGALLFVYPSHFEGFGLPPLEAMACGTPVITTTGGALPEIAGDAALLVPPGDVQELARAMRRLLGDSPLRTELSARGIDRAAEFSWDRSARLMQDLIEEVAKS